MLMFACWTGSGAVRPASGAGRSPGETREEWRGEPGQGHAGVAAVQQRDLSEGCQRETAARELETASWQCGTVWCQVMS